MKLVADRLFVCRSASLIAATLSRSSLRMMDFVVFGWSDISVLLKPGAKSSFAVARTSRPCLKSNAHTGEMPVLLNYDTSDAPASGEGSDFLRMFVNRLSISASKPLLVGE